MPQLARCRGEPLSLSGIATLGFDSSGRRQRRCNSCFVYENVRRRLSSLCRGCKRCNEKVQTLCDAIYVVAPGLERERGNGAGLRNHVHALFRNMYYGDSSCTRSLTNLETSPHSRHADIFPLCALCILTRAAVGQRRGPANFEALVEDGSALGPHPSARQGPAAKNPCQFTVRPCLAAPRAISRVAVSPLMHEVMQHAIANEYTGKLRQIS